MFQHASDHCIDRDELLSRVSRYALEGLFQFQAYILFLKPNFHCYEAVQHEFVFKSKISVDKLRCGRELSAFCSFPFLLVG